MLLFTALTLIASGPHPFDRGAGPAHQHAAGIGSPASQADASCPLCDWAAHSVAVAAQPPDAAPLCIIQALPHTPHASFHQTPTVRRPTGRAPPLRFT